MGDYFMNRTTLTAVGFSFSFLRGLQAQVPPTNQLPGASLSESTKLQRTGQFKFALVNAAGTTRIEQ